MVKAYSPIEGLMGTEGAGRARAGGGRGPLGDRRIQSLERDPDIFVVLKPGWRLPGTSHNPQHEFGEDSIKDVKETMKGVEPCDCPSCKRCK